MHCTLSLTSPESPIFLTLLPLILVALHGDRGTPPEMHEINLKFSPREPTIDQWSTGGSVMATIGINAIKWDHHEDDR